MVLFFEILSIILLILGAYALVNSILNIRFFKKKSDVKMYEGDELISIVVPARNEEDNLEAMLESLLCQTYRNIEILVLDDQSTDRTWDIIRKFEERDSRVHGFQSKEGLTLNKNGKINALLQVIPYVKGDYFIATDADTIHSPDCVRKTISIMKADNLDIISGFPTEFCPRYMGSVFMSAMMLTSVFIPHYLVYKLKLSGASFAIGQFIMMKTSSYIETGGYSKINGTICDDVGIVRLFVKNGKKYAFISITDAVRCNMYGSTKDSFHGIERSIAGVFPPRPAYILLAVILATVLLVMALAPLSAAFAWVHGYSLYAASILSGWLLLAYAWYYTSRRTNWSRAVSLSFSIMLIAVAIMYIHGLAVEIFGKGFVWKGRFVK